MNEWERRGKESSPADTIKNIHNIAGRLGYSLKTGEEIADVKDCFSIRLVLDGELGNYIGTNGKGMSHDLCMASACGEMGERLSNRCFNYQPRFDDDRYDELYVNRYPLYEVRGTYQPECITNLKRKLADTVEMPEIFRSHADFIDEFLEELAPVQLAGKYPTLPFFSIKEKKVVYLPEFMKLFVWSNGMAGGNTFEEAMVQALSEIAERFAHMRLFDGDLVPPQIPREVIGRYPHIMKIIEDIESRGNYSVRVLDCSLGIGLPVVCGLIIDQETGHFGVRPGAHPDMAIALERVFTEAFQGKNLKGFVQNNTPDFNVRGNGNFVNKWNTMKVGMGKFPVEILLDTPTYEYKSWSNVSGMSNRELMWKLIDDLGEMGEDVLIRDASYLGFGAVWVYVPGLSETVPVDVKTLQLERLYHRVQEHFKDLSKLSDNEVKEIRTFAAAKTGAAIENTINTMAGAAFREEMPGAPTEEFFLRAACSYALGDDKEALKILRSILLNKERYSEKMSSFLQAVYIYIDGVSAGRDEEEVYCILQKFFPETAEGVREVFKDRKSLLGKTYPSFTDMGDEDLSVYPLIHELYARLVKAEAENGLSEKELIKKCTR